MVPKKIRAANTDESTCQQDESQMGTIYSTPKTVLAEVDTCIVMSHYSSHNSDWDTTPVLEVEHGGLHPWMKTKRSYKIPRIEARSKRGRCATGA